MDKLEFADQVPYVPVNWSDRDSITGKVLNIIEAVLPEGKQLEATKQLVKDVTRDYWIALFNHQFDALKSDHDFPSDTTQRFSRAIAKEAGLQ